MLIPKGCTRAILLCLLAVGSVAPRAMVAQSSSPNATVTATITPNPAKFYVSTSGKFNWSVTGMTNPSLTWTVNGVVGGSSTYGRITSAGLYFAPAQAPSGPVTVGFFVTSSPTVKATATVNVFNVAPTVKVVAPAALTAGVPVNLWIDGNNFNAGSKVIIGTTTFTPVFTSTTRLLVRSAVIATSGSYSLTVTSPAPGGGTSNVVRQIVLPVHPLVSQAAATRFLEQSSFGPTPDTVALVQLMGFQNYLTYQFGLSYPTMTVPTGNNAMDLVKGQFYRLTLTSSAQLRLRVALALQEIIVVSAFKVTDPQGIVSWVNFMQSNAFGNYRTLFKSVAMHPAMGHYLDIANNNKTDPASGVDPNENYAREQMQLFSIGLYMLNQDGTQQLDGSGNPINTYGQPQIEGFARVFTGWTYPRTPGITPSPNNPEYYVGNMEAFDVNHDMTAKTLLNGVVLPAGQSTITDLDQGTDNVFTHPNVGPFIGKQLIQHLVKSNPSPAYVARISAVFNNNGAGVRGDLKAVVTAILLDPEARAGDSAPPTATDGKLQEPILFMIGALRRLNGSTDGQSLLWWGQQMGQDILEAPSVFNYFPPDYFLDDVGLLGPEFALYNSATVQVRANFLNQLLFSNSPWGTAVDIVPYDTMGGNATALVSQLNGDLMHGSMSSGMQSDIVTAVDSIAPSNGLYRAQQALYLLMNSNEYQVSH